MKNLVNYLDDYVYEEDTSYINHKSKLNTKKRFDEDLENINNYIKKHKNKNK